MAATQIEDRFENWHPFDPNAFDGTQLRYPASHVERFPVGSPAARFHRRVSKEIEEAYADLVSDHLRYWESDDRDAWFNRILMSEILPGYIQALDEAERRVNQDQDVDYQNNAPRLRFGKHRFHIDIPDMIESMIAVAEFFTPEIPDDEVDCSDDDEEEKCPYFFEEEDDRNRLCQLRNEHLRALDALHKECKA